MIEPVVEIQLPEDEPALAAPAPLEPSAAQEIVAPPPGAAARSAVENLSALSPAMRQYRQFKTQYPDYVLFFRMGDFYEMFWEDAQLAARTLGVALTSRSKGEDAIPMAGVPFHAVDGYLRRMIAAGHRVAICEQMEDPAPDAAKGAKGVIQREVVRLMTPGTLTDEPLLEGSAPNYLAAVASGITRNDGFRTALAWVDLSTGDCVALSGNETDVLDEISRLRPAEVLVAETPTGQPGAFDGRIRQACGGAPAAIATRPAWQFTPHHGREQLRNQWQARTAHGFGFADDDPAIAAVAALLSYLQETQKRSLSHIRPPRRQIPSDYLNIDPASWRSLEIDRTTRGNSTEGSLLHSIDATRTSMGGRLLRQWLRCPLRDLSHIEARQSAIAALLDAPQLLEKITGQLQGICDIERIVARLSVGRLGPRDLSALHKCLAGLPALFDALEALPRSFDVTPELSSQRNFCQERGEFLRRAIAADPPPHLREGGVIATGFDAELDRLRNIGTSSQSWLANYQSQLAGESGIPSLKVGYNKVFGYYIEVTESQRGKALDHWTRKQTVKNAERYITPELKQFETEALGARDRAIALEQQLFEQIRQQLLPHVPALQDLAAGIGRLDVLAALANLARDRRYCRPSLHEQRGIEIVDGRHPVLEQQLGAQFVSNDLNIAGNETLLLITGPNMAGKSTYIRQAALIVILAQIGSYVPAKSARIGIADRLFARIGASDEIHGGQSTFMVEMTETANLLNNATDRSLVVLDEVGRGTSTLDGLSLAWAMSEHVAVAVRCRTLFATHYHELTELSERFVGVRNLNVAVREWEDEIIFLHRIVEGGASRSYGIHVARLAGVPQEVLKRARRLLGELAVQHIARPRISRRGGGNDPAQLPLFGDPVRQVADELAAMKLDEMTPEAALALLKQLQQKLK